MPTTRSANSSTDRVQQEEQISNSITRALVQKLIQERQQRRRQQPPDLPVDDPVDKVLAPYIQSIRTAIPKGILAASLSLILLRKWHWRQVYRLQQVQQQRHQGQTGRGSSNSPFRQSSQVSPRSDIHVKRAGSSSDTKYSSIKNILDWILDVAASMAVGVTTTMYCLPKDADFSLVEGFDTLPLIEGKSLFLSRLCPVMVEHYQALKESDANKVLLQDPQTERLRAIQSFSINCEHRMKQEDLLRYELGLDDTDEVSIPPPGVIVGATDVDAFEWAMATSY
ncbi:hypothetical protein MPSEU_000114500 [Mayamaea pseudoterrestris]|nr:hypothetical protein MPSEU_000114500 [Mayamaea pseudoterrestris]